MLSLLKSEAGVVTLFTKLNLVFQEKWRLPELFSVQSVPIFRVKKSVLCVSTADISIPIPFFLHCSSSLCDNYHSTHPAMKYDQDTASYYA